MKLKSPIFLCFLSLSVFLASCDEGTKEKKGAQKKVEETKGKKAPGNASIVKVGDKLFNIPSPLETAFLIEKVGGNFNENVLSGVADVNKFSTKQDQALNLGIFGADLAYTLIHNQSQQAFAYLASCKKLGTELGISPALYADLMGRFQGNMDNKDSLLIFISELNRLSDEYLKENESEDVSAMILAGGWVESLYFATKLMEATGNDKLRQRVAEQKKTIENLIGILDQQNSDGALDKLIAQLNDLKASYASVNTTYEYVAPETKADNKLTIIKSKTTVEMSDATFKEISTKIANLRNEITGNS